MTISKKLASTQIFIYAISIISVIAFSSLAWISASKDISNESKTFLFSKRLFASATQGITGALFLLLTLVGFLIGIIQIVYKVKEQTSSVYLAAGICAILSSIPLVGLLTLVLNIIGLTIKE